MPVVNISPSDLLRNKVVEPAWYRMQINEVEEKLSKDQQSTNYVMEAVIIRNADTGDEKFAGVPIVWNFNSKAIGFVVNFLKVLLGEENVQAGRVDLAAAKGMEIEVMVENDTWDGRIINRVNHNYRSAK